MNNLLAGKRPASRRTSLTVLAVCATVAAVVALPSIANGFVYDDVWIVERNDVVHQLDLAELLVSPFWPEDRGDVMWRPVALVGFAVQWVLGGGAPFLFRVVSILLYGVVAGMAGLLFARMFTPRLGLLAGLLFAVHPVHVEVTANAVGQAELWAALGYIGALLAAWERTGTENPRLRLWLLILVLLCLAIGLGGKEQPVTLPAAILALWWLRARYEDNSFTAVAGREWVVPAASCLVIAAFLWLRAEFGGGLTAAGGIATGLDPDSPLRRTFVMLPVTLLWLRLLFVPFALSADYSPLHLVPESTLGANHILAVMIWAGLLAIVFLSRDRLRAVFVGVLLFAITVSVVSNIVVPLEVLMAERLLFLPSLGWALAVSSVVLVGIDKVKQVSERRALLVAAGVVVAVFAARSMFRATVWRNNEVFFAALVDDAPDSFRSHWATGHFAFEQGDSARGERELLTAVRLNPEHPQLLEDFGRLYASTGRYEPAIPLLSHAVSIDSTRLSSALPLALSLARSGKETEALSVLDAMSGLHGETRGISVVRGEVLMRDEAFEEALSVLLGLVQREPDLWSVRMMAADAALNAGLCDIALAQADTALSMAPEAERPNIETFKATVANGKTICK